MTNVLINAPKTAKKGEVIELKALILHPMETGFRPGPNGRIIPRNIIERFTASWNGSRDPAHGFLAGDLRQSVRVVLRGGDRERQDHLPLDRR